MCVCVGGRGVPSTARYPSTATNTARELVAFLPKEARGAAGILSVMLHCDTQPDWRLAMPPYLSKQVEPALQPKLGTPATFISCSD